MSESNIKICGVYDITILITSEFGTLITEDIE